LGFGLFVGNIVSGVGLGHFSWGYRSLGPSTKGKYFSEAFSAN